MTLERDALFGGNDAELEALLGEGDEGDAGDGLDPDTDTDPQSAELAALDPAERDARIISRLVGEADAREKAAAEEQEAFRKTLREALGDRDPDWRPEPEPLTPIEQAAVDIAKIKNEQARAELFEMLKADNERIIRDTRRNTDGFDDRGEVLPESKPLVDPLQFDSATFREFVKWKSGAANQQVPVGFSRQRWQDIVDGTAVEA